MANSMQPHIRLGPNDGADYALLPGDPERVDRVKQFLHDTREVAYNREFKTVIGYYKEVKILVTSTGIGGPSTAIAIEELKNIGVKTMIRIGSCGAIQHQIKLGDLVIPSGAVREEGTSSAYIKGTYPAIPDAELLFSVISSAKKLNYPYHYGTIRSHDSFYTNDEEAKDLYWKRNGILSSDMETSVLYVIGQLNNLNVASILNNVVEANGATNEGINQYVDGAELTHEGETREIMTALEAIIDFNNKKKELMK